MPLSGLENTTGTKIHVAVGEPTDYTAANLALLTWAEIVGTVSFGEWGDTEADVTEPLLSEGRVIHTLGMSDGGEAQLVVQYRSTDAGSDIIIANSGANTLITILKEYGESGEGEVATGVFTSPKYRAASGDSVRGYTSLCRLNTGVTELSAADVTTALA